MKTKQQVKDDVAKDYGYNSMSLLLMAFREKRINKLVVDNFYKDILIELKK